MTFDNTYVYMETSINNENMPMVRMCSYCQGINNPGAAQQATYIDKKIKDEIKIIDKKVRELSSKFNFTHGLCNPHYLQSYQQIPGITKERMASIKEKLQNNKDPIPCLLVQDNEPLRQAYMQGLFTPELMKQSKQAQQQSNQQLTERFKKLAGIKS